MQKLFLSHIACRFQFLPITGPKTNHLSESKETKTGWPQFSSVRVCAWDGSNGSSFRFRRFLWEMGFSVVPYSVNKGYGCGSSCGSVKTQTKKNSSHRRAILWRTFCEGLWAVLEGIFRSYPQTSQKLPMCGNHQSQRILGQHLRSLLQNPWNFSELLQKSALRCIRLLSVLKTVLTVPVSSSGSVLEPSGKKRKKVTLGAQRVTFQSLSSLLT